MSNDVWTTRIAWSPIEVVDPHGLSDRRDGPQPRRRKCDLLPLPHLGDLLGVEGHSRRVPAHMPEDARGLPRDKEVADHLREGVRSSAPEGPSSEVTPKKLARSA